MSVLTQDIRQLPWGAKLLDDVEAAEAAVKKAVETPITENLVAAANAASTAVQTVTQTAAQIVANPAPTGVILAEDAISFVGTNIENLLKAKLGTSSTVPLTFLSAVLAAVNSEVAKL